MSSNSLRDAEETGANRADDGESDPLVRLFQMVLEEESGRSAGKDGSVVRPFLLVDLGAVTSYVRGDRSRPVGVIEDRIEGKLRSAAEETLQTGSDERGRETTGDRRETTGDGQEGGGRGVLSKLFIVGVVAGLGYVLTKRSGSADEVVSEATERAESVADETAMRSGEAAGKTETVSEKVANRIEHGGEVVAERIREGSETAAERVEEGSEQAAEQVQKGGEQAADEMEAAGETVEEVEEKAEESADEMTDSDEESESGQESEE